MISRRILYQMIFFLDFFCPEFSLTAIICVFHSLFFTALDMNRFFKMDLVENRSRCKAHITPVRNRSR